MEYRPQSVCRAGELGMQVHSQGAGQRLVLPEAPVQLDRWALLGTWGRLHVCRVKWHHTREASGEVRGSLQLRRPCSCGHTACVCSQASDTELPAPTDQ